MYFINVAAVALMSLVCNAMVQGAGSDHVARVAVPEARAITDGDLVAREVRPVELNHEFNTAPRQVLTNVTVTVTVTTIPDFCTTAPVSILTTAPVSIRTSAVPLTSAAPLAVPAGPIFPVPQNVTAMASTGTGVRSTLISTQTSTLVSVSSTAPISPVASSDATAGSYSVLLLVATVALAFVHSAMLV